MFTIARGLPSGCHLRVNNFTAPAVSSQTSCAVMPVIISSFAARLKGNAD
jgi:hypothetical protein